jgi:hypothetical protein
VEFGALLESFKDMTRQDQVAFAKAASGLCGMIAIFPNQMVQETPKQTPRKSEQKSAKKTPVKQEIKNPLHSQPIYDRFKAAKKLIVEAKKEGEIPSSVSKEFEWAKATYFRLLQEAKESGKVELGQQMPPGADQALNERINEASATNYKEYVKLVPNLWGEVEGAKPIPTPPPKVAQQPPANTENPGLTGPAYAGGKPFKSDAKASQLAKALLNTPRSLN